jgi:hypothetical protein
VFGGVPRDGTQKRTRQESKDSFDSGAGKSSSILIEYKWVISISFMISVPKRVSEFSFDKSKRMNNV